MGHATPGIFWRINLFIAEAGRSDTDNTGKYDVGLGSQHFQSGWQDNTGLAGSLPAGASTAPSNLATAGNIASGIQAGAQLVGGIIDSSQNKRLRESSYKATMNEIMQAKIEQERQQKIAQQRMDEQKMRDKGGLFLSMFSKDLQKKQAQRNRAFQAIDRLNERARYDESFRDALNNFSAQGV